MNLRYFYFLFLFSCSIEDETFAELTYYEDCYFEEDKVSKIDLFQGYMTLEMDYAYMPDFNFSDSLLSDYYYLKFSNNELEGTYVITDAIIRYKLNKVQPYDTVSIREYPFSTDLTGNKVCVYLDLSSAERCNCK